MRFLAGVFLFFHWAAIVANAQLNYTFPMDVSVSIEDNKLMLPFAGGFVAPQFSAIDLNNDGVEDLFVFDRASNKISTYLYQEGNYVYAPQYENAFPAGMKSWVLLRDFNCDNKPDIFTSSIFGMSLFENTSSGDNLSWELLHQTIYTEGSNGQINLQVSSYDMPGIVDVDGDGDIDILNFNFAIGGGVEFHKNMSVENTGSCDMDLVRITKRYGEFEECTCEDYIFGSEECPTIGGRLKHSGGKSILSFDATGSGVQDILIGQEYCVYPGFLKNTGTQATPLMSSVDFDFPVASDPLRMEYPAFYEIDVDHDGTKDLIAAPNTYLTEGTQDYTLLLAYYKGAAGGQYSHITDSFLKDEMIDVGYKASPAFADIDFDGDEDLLIGTGKIGSGASVWYFENTGNSSAPSFNLKNTDFLGLSSEGNESIRLQFLDVNSNNEPDMVVYKIKEGALTAVAYLNTGNANVPYELTNSIALQLPVNSVWDAPHLFPLGNSYGLLIGKQVGNLEYYLLSGSLEGGAWQLVSDTYLGFGEDFNKRNPRVIVGDFNANGTQDMLSVNDSGEVLVFENFTSGNTPIEVNGFDEDSGQLFGLGFGSQSNPYAANLFGTREPAIAFGLLQGGIQILKNTTSTPGGNELALKVSAYPVPVKANQLVLQSNKDCLVRLIDSMGKQLTESFTLPAGSAQTIDLIVVPGVYFVEFASFNERKIIRIAVID
ncbi:MAG: T9SS type A sorting domain-containing protein [Cyclobacteriaceae bacterium]|nr:T9SS type A sorting domain-containing protein [Cyclobacteriaceae bacterium]